MKAKKFETSSGNVKSSLKTHKAMCFTVVNPTCYSETPMTQKAKIFDGDGLALSGRLFRPELKFMGAMRTPMLTSHIPITSCCPHF